MNAFVTAINSPKITTTTNGMAALTGSGNALVDLFYKAGSLRGKSLVSDFALAYAENPELAARLALWTRDVRGGAGERQHFRDFMLFLEKANPELVLKMLPLVSEVGRFDDLFIFKTNALFDAAACYWFSALAEGNKLAGKWAPRKGEIANRLAKIFNLTPKLYRKMIVRCSDTVEQRMCANLWDEIEFSHVPSVAAKLYAKAFAKRATERYTHYKQNITAGKAKVNASAVYPYQIIQFLNKEEDKTVPQKMWDSLPNYMDDTNILPMVDVSGSMTVPVKGTSVSCLDVALSLGLYCSDKASGEFKDVVLTFSARPQLLKLKGDLFTKLTQLKRAEWGMNTNIQFALNRILHTAKSKAVPQKDMPKVLLILSDMQFDAATTGSPYNSTAMSLVEKLYEQAGYTVPKVVFWNLADYGSTPVTFDHSGTALVSGFSPSVMKAVLSKNLETFTPESVMMEAIMSSRYSF